jgi:hypothetical protein
MVLGDAFPESVAEEAKSLSRLFEPAVAVVTSFATVPKIPTIVPATRFHGD